MLVRADGGSTAALPLRSLQAEFGIDDASADGQMLARVARSLDFVIDLRLGDPLPVEVLDGAASWQPSPKHQELAMSRLKLQLVSQLEADTATDWGKAEPRAVLAAAKDPGLRLSLQAAYVEAATLLGFPNAAAAAQLPDGRTVDVPMGYAAFPKEIRRPPRSIAAQSCTDIRRWTTMDKGGHFAAMEQPMLLAPEIAAFFRPLRKGVGQGLEAPCAHAGLAAESRARSMLQGRAGSPADGLDAGIPSVRLIQPGCLAAATTEQLDGAEGAAASPRVGPLATRRGRAGR